MLFYRQVMMPHSRQSLDVTPSTPSGSKCLPSSALVCTLLPVSSTNTRHQKRPRLPASTHPRYIIDRSRYGITIGPTSPEFLGGGDDLDDIEEAEGLVWDLALAPESDQDEEGRGEGDNREAREPTRIGLSHQKTGETRRNSEARSSTGRTKSALEAPQRLPLSVRTSTNALPPKPKHMLAARKTILPQKTPLTRPLRSARKVAVATDLFDGDETDHAEDSDPDDLRLSPPRPQSPIAKQRPLSSPESAGPSKVPRTYTVDFEHRKRMADTALGPRTTKRQRRSDGQYRRSPQAPTTLVSSGDTTATRQKKRKAARKQVAAITVIDLTWDTDSDEEEGHEMGSSPEMSDGEEETSFPRQRSKTSREREDAILSQTNHRPLETIRAIPARMIAQNIDASESGSPMNLTDDTRDGSDAEVPVGDDNVNEKVQEDPLHDMIAPELFISEAPQPASPTPALRPPLLDVPSWELPTIEGVAQDLSSSQFHLRRFSSIFSRRIARRSPSSTSEYLPSYNCRPFLRKNMRIRLQGTSAFLDPDDAESIEYIARLNQYRKLEGTRRKEDNALGIDMKERFRVVDEDLVARGADFNLLKQGVVLNMTFEGVFPVGRAPSKCPYQAQIIVRLEETVLHAVTVPIVQYKIHPQTTLSIPLSETFIKNRQPDYRTSMKLQILLFSIGRVQELYTSSDIDIVASDGHLAQFGPSINLRPTSLGDQAPPILLCLKTDYNFLPSPRFYPVSVSLSKSSKDVEVTYIVKKSNAGQSSVVVVSGFTCPLCSDLDGAGHTGSRQALFLHLSGHRKEAKLDEKRSTEKITRSGRLLKLTVFLKSRAKTSLVFANKYIKFHHLLPTLAGFSHPSVTSSPTEADGPMLSSPRQHLTLTKISSATHPPPDKLLEKPSLTSEGGTVEGALLAPAPDDDGRSSAVNEMSGGVEGNDVEDTPQKPAPHAEGGSPAVDELSQTEAMDVEESAPVAQATSSKSGEMEGNDVEDIPQEPAPHADGASGELSRMEAMDVEESVPVVQAMGAKTGEIKRNNDEDPSQGPASHADGGPSVVGELPRVEVMGVEDITPVAQATRPKDLAENMPIVPTGVYADIKEITVSASSPPRIQPEISAVVGSSDLEADKDQNLVDSGVSNIQSSPPIQAKDDKPAAPVAPSCSSVAGKEPDTQVSRGSTTTPTSLSHHPQRLSQGVRSPSLEHPIPVLQSNADISAGASNVEEGSEGIVPEGHSSVLAKASEPFQRAEVVPDLSEPEQENDETEGSSTKVVEAVSQEQTSITSPLARTEPQHTAIVSNSADTDTEDAPVFVPVIKAPRKTQLPSREIESVKRPMVRLTLPAQKSNLSELMPEQSSASDSRSSSIVAIEQEDIAMDTEVDTAASDTVDDAATPVPETPTTHPAQPKLRGMSRTPQASTSLSQSSTPPAEDVSKVAAIMQGSVLGENEKSNDPNTTPVEAVSPSRVPDNGMQQEAKSDSDPQNQLRPGLRDLAVLRYTPRFTESGFAGPYMGQRVNEWTEWSHAVVPGTLFDFMHELDKLWDCGGIRHVVKHQEASIWTRNHLSEKRRFLACCWNRWTYEKGPIPGINKAGHLKLFLDKYGTIMTRAGIDFELKDYLHIHFQMKHISLADYVGACQYYKGIRGSV
ncbi:hypothetical protein L198_04587 [Cryptococcus wingfieldii CBS 7118]|uniref:Uncharacterized protein n=1 Tax=Cryptococcus wingfieldii CBS 7118 TaxID=1295528 RepID=A0A1E3J2X4_9TREE|nr:hypothetical protein L198_04587 [Cryptococcus wingfieldii CBS 7118]ODN95199.1 hypothetical protein L198_04587 [Cryptococcus wingfieldii CBS 7118]